MLGILDDWGSHNPYPVASGGFLLGAQTTLVLFGLHIGQVARYYHRFGTDDKRRYRHLLVPLVFIISATHIGLVCASMYHYFVHGILEPTVWGSFYWGLSAQDFVIPMISAVAHVFFSWRVVVLARIKVRYWYFFLIFIILTLGSGLAFAALARLWAKNPWVSWDEYRANPYGRSADVLPTVWLASAGLIDGLITASLLYILLREGKITRNARRLTSRIIALTLETVLLTHLIGATLFVLWLTSRTRTNAFWFFIEIISETYSLSILFTLNSRAGFRKAAKPDGDEMIEHQLQAMHQESRDLEESPTSNNTSHDQRLPPPQSERRRGSQLRPDDDDSKANTPTWDEYTPMSEREAKVFLPSLDRDWDRYQTSDSSARSSQQQSKRSDEAQDAGDAPRQQKALSLPKPIPP